MKSERNLNLPPPIVKTSLIDGSFQGRAGLRGQQPRVTSGVRAVQISFFY